MKVRLGRRVFDETELVAVARLGPQPDPGAVLAAVEHAVTAGADIVDLVEDGAEDPAHGAAPLVAAVRSRHPRLVIGVTVRHRRLTEGAVDAGADVLTAGDGDAPGWLAEVAANAGVGLVTASTAQAERAVGLGVRPDGILVRAPFGTPLGDPLDGAASWPEAIARLPELVATGWPVLVELPDGDDEERHETMDTVPAAALCAWLGARVFATRRVRHIRQALDMVASIRGTREPTLSRRGLA